MMTHDTENIPYKQPASLQVNIENSEGVIVQVQVDIFMPGHEKLSRHFDSNPSRNKEAKQRTNQAQPSIDGTTASSRFISLVKKPFYHFFSKIKNQSFTKNHTIQNAPQNIKQQNRLFALAIGVYLLVRLVGLTNYPVFFTFDEANPTLLASDFLKNGFRNSNGEFFPAFFQNIDKYSLGTTVYIQIFPLLLFGKSAFAVRATSVLVGLFGAIFISLILRDIFHNKFWWTGILIFSAIPAWFHHSRTAYETVTFVSFYAGMLYFYLLYQNKKPVYLYFSIQMAALAFYSYASGQVLIPLTMLGFFISDFRQHYRERVTVFRGLGLMLLNTIPFILFRITHPTDTNTYLNNLKSYLLTDIPIVEKITTFINRYYFHISPVYWFTPENNATSADALLHIMKNYGHLPLYLFPFLTLGLLICLRGFRRASYRTILVAMLIAPVAASIVLSPSSITRILVMLIPFSLLASLGLEQILEILLRKINSRPAVIKTWSVLLFLVFASINFGILGDVLINGTHWFENNQIEGVQFGAVNVFDSIQKQISTDPSTHFYISPNWTMMPDLLSQFFLTDISNVSFQSIYDFSSNKLPLEENSEFILTPEEYRFSQQSPKFLITKNIQTIPYSPDKVGFYIVQLSYSKESELLISNEITERQKPITTRSTIDGQPVTISYPPSEGMGVDQLFDNDLATLFKTKEANPGVFELIFDKPRLFKSFFIIHGSSPIELIITFYSEKNEQLPSLSTTFMEGGIQGNTLIFPQPVTSKKVVFSVRDLTQKEPGKLHIWEIRLE